MEKRKKIHRLTAFLLCVILINASAVPAAVRTEEAEGQVLSATTDQQAEGSAEDSSGTRAVDGRGIWDRIREKLPEIDFAEFDADAEKEKLREAVRTMDELGISPEMLVRNAWDFLSRKENRKKIDQAVDNLRDKVEEVTGGDSAGN